MLETMKKWIYFNKLTEIRHKVAINADFENRIILLLLKRFDYTTKTVLFQAVAETVYFRF
jgi:hypothetical protein